jgi:hypothetical protein
MAADAARVEWDLGWKTTRNRPTQKIISIVLWTA